MKEKHAGTYNTQQMYLSVQDWITRQKSKLLYSTFRQTQDETFNITLNVNLI